MQLTQVFTRCGRLFDSLRGTSTAQSLLWAEIDSADENILTTSSMDDGDLQIVDIFLGALTQFCRIK